MMMTTHQTAYQRLPTDEAISEAKQTEAKDKHVSRLWRITCFIVTGFFILCAVVQVNDPDPYIWIPVYGIPAILTLAIALKPEYRDSKVWKVIITIHLLLCLVGTIMSVYIVGGIMDGKVYNPLVHEEGREMSGLIIIVVWLGVSGFTGIGREHPEHHTGQGLLVLTILLGVAPLIFWSLCFVEGLAHMGHCKDMFPGILGKEPYIKV